MIFPCGVAESFDLVKRLPSTFAILPAPGALLLRCDGHGVSVKCESHPPQYHVGVGLIHWLCRVFGVYLYNNKNICNVGLMD